MDNFILAGKAKSVFRLIELMAMGEKQVKQQVPVKNNKKFRLGK
ncbi:hypothetical protein ACFLTT_01270 [Chloroflexota bacterium]